MDPHDSVQEWILELEGRIREVGSDEGEKRTFRGLFDDKLGDRGVRSDICIFLILYCFI